MPLKVHNVVATAFIVSAVQNAAGTVAHQHLPHVVETKGIAELDTPVAG